jgi:hydroxyethylthiazole kinase-like uncharacterized protein yjeF
MSRRSESESLPRRITSESGPWPLHGVTAARAIEAGALATAAPYDLMERAGLGVARMAWALVPHASWVEVWCGPGNNGGDGWVAARRLHEAGTPVRVRQCGDENHLPADAAQARRRALEAGVVAIGAEVGAVLSVKPSAGATPDASAPAPDLVIDGLLGLGASRPPSDTLAAAIRCINARAASGAQVLAIDLPSGLHPDGGQPLGDAVVHAHHTLALLSLKPGLFTAQGRDLAGEVWFDALGAMPAAAGPGTADAQLLGPTPLGQRAPHAMHKGSRGDAWIVGGTPGMVGAAWLAARAALAAGAGRVYLSPLDAAARAAFDPARPELMLRPLGALDGRWSAQATVVCGCGGGAAIREPLPGLLAHAARLVLDADALNQIAAEPALLRLLQGRSERGQGTVLTPHPLEAARLLATTSLAIQADRLRAARDLGELSHAVVVLKGSGTIVAAPGALCAINPSGNAALASAGTGDVLAGWLGGLWAQQPTGSAHELAGHAVWLHGHAADVVRPQGRGAPMLAADLIDAMHRLA